MRDPFGPVPLYERGLWRILAEYADFLIPLSVAGGSPECGNCKGSTHP